MFLLTLFFFFLSPSGADTSQSVPKPHLLIFSLAISLTASAYQSIRSVQADTNKQKQVPAFKILVCKEESQSRGQSC